MMGPTHVAIGTATGLGLCALTTPTPTRGIAFIAACSLASKLPDQLEMGMLPHRGPTHWLIATPLVAFVLGLCAEMIAWTQPIAPEIMGGVFVGYLMHLFADSCTVSGVRLLKPFHGRDCWLVPIGLRVVTRSPLTAKERFVGLAATAVSIGLAAMLVLPLPRDGIIDLPEPQSSYRVP